MCSLCAPQTGNQQRSWRLASKRNGQLPHGATAGRAILDCAGPEHGQRSWSLTRLPWIFCIWMAKIRDILELDGKLVSLRQWRWCVSCHAVVMQGELLSDYCPRCYKVTTCSVCARVRPLSSGPVPTCLIRGELDLEREPAKKQGRPKTDHGRCSAHKTDPKKAKHIEWPALSGKKIRVKNV